MIFVWPVPENHFALYEEDYFSGAKNELGYADYESDREILGGTFKKYLKKTEAILPRKGKLLDVGAATGHFLELARKNGWEASGIEISKYAAKKARKKGLEIAVGDFENHEFSENCFDAVTFWDVLEHFGKPDLAFKQARKILRTGGILAINTPDSRSVLARIFGKRWHAIVPPNHLNLFNCDNLKAVLEKNGFEVMKISRVGKKFSLQTVFKVLANWQENPVSRKISNYFLKSRMGRINFYLNLRDNIFLIARKK
ncbi:MAG: hypothetical protein A2612_05540 [Candidatus Moranbacteria bacterium RIFOXYD1_FULL_44_12]|nr:MAG: hypothetical protein A2612_05540 [Candidatus Moranbacteria bacterium RIFOXYD1_FULL_44_12]